MILGKKKKETSFIFIETKIKISKLSKILGVLITCFFKKDIFGQKTFITPELLGWKRSKTIL